VRALVRLASLAMLMLLGCGRATCEKKPGPATSAPEPPPPPAKSEADADEPDEPDDPDESAAPEPSTEEERALLKRVNRIRRSRKVDFRAPTEAEERAYGAWVTAAIRAARTDSPPPEGAPEGFVLERIEGAPHIWLLAERQRDRRGAGAASSCRTRLGDTGVRAFPTEIGVLGGLTNVQARSSARAGSPFYHIEIGRSLRDRLGKDAAARRRFAEALPAPPEASH